MPWQLVQVGDREAFDAQCTRQSFTGSMTASDPINAGMGPPAINSGRFLRGVTGTHSRRAWWIL